MILPLKLIRILEVVEDVPSVGITKGDILWGHHLPGGVLGADYFCSSDRKRFGWVHCEDVNLPAPGTLIRVAFPFSGTIKASEVVRIDDEMAVFQNRFWVNDRKGKFGWVDSFEIIEEPKTDPAPVTEPDLPAPQKDDLRARCGRQRRELRRLNEKQRVSLLEKHRIETTLENALQEVLNLRQRLRVLEAAV